MDNYYYPQVILSAICCAIHQLLPWLIISQSSDHNSDINHMVVRNPIDPCGPTCEVD